MWKVEGAESPCSGNEKWISPFVVTLAEFILKVTSCKLYNSWILLNILDIFHAPSSTVSKILNVFRFVTKMNIKKENYLIPEEISNI